MRNSRRIMLRLSLGILCGLILILLPALFLPGPEYSPITANCSSCKGPAYQELNPKAPSAAPAASTITPYPNLPLLEILFLILLPSLLFSVLVRRWAESRTSVGEHPFE